MREEEPVNPPPKSLRNPNKLTVEVFPVDIAMIIAPSKVKIAASKSPILDLCVLDWLLELPVDVEEDIDNQSSLYSYSMIQKTKGKRNRTERELQRVDAGF